MATIISHNVISPLGLSSCENFNAILEGKSSIDTYEGKIDSRQYSASLFSEETKRMLKVEGYSTYESLIINSIKQSLSEIKIDLTSQDVALILSTTKGNIEQLECGVDEYATPAVSAQRIASFFGIKTMPITVCNACISGVSAMVLAQRLLDGDSYKAVIVCGCDVQTNFIISGFQSLNAVSSDSCRPFDIERIGLSVGEAVASMVIVKETIKGKWQISKGYIRNDAYHNTTPSPIGEGCYLALRKVSENLENIAFVNAHGTATMFNDQMESKAISRAGLSQIPLNALKGYFGHTMGAAGILETIMSMCAIESGVVIGTNGFSEIGVSGKINVVSENIPTSKKSFVKIISGFGGCNGAIRLTRDEDVAELPIGDMLYTKGPTIKITPQNAFIGNNKIATTESGKGILKELYKNHIGNYPKFYKMDLLSQLGFIATELLINSEETLLKSISGENCAIVLFNSSSSILTDKEYLKTISDKDDYFPSPALFVYTLPNIVLSEIATKNTIKGETALYIISRKDDKVINEIIKSTFVDSDIEIIISGWIDCFSETDFSAEISILQRN